MASAARTASRRIAERGHHRVANGLDHRAVVVAHDRSQQREMLSHDVVCSGVAHPLVERRRALQVGEEQRDLADARIVAGPQGRFGEQVAKGLQRDHFRRGQRIARPGAVLDQGRELEIRVVHERDACRVLLLSGEFSASTPDAVMRRPGKGPASYSTSTNVPGWSVRRR